MNNVSKVKISSSAYADDLVAFANKLKSLRIQFNKLDKFCTWASMDFKFPNAQILDARTISKWAPLHLKLKFKLPI